MWQENIRHQICQQIADQKGGWSLVQWCALADAMTEAEWPYLGAYVIAEARHLPRSRHRHRVRNLLRWEDWMHLCVMEVRMEHYYLSPEWIDRQIAGEADDLRQLGRR